MNRKLYLLMPLAWCFIISAYAQDKHRFVINASHPIAEIQPVMYGVFFEDINFAADGGIYAELVKNRSFEFEEPLMGWIQPNSDRHSLNGQSGIAAIMKTGEQPNERYARVTVNKSSGYKLINEGFRGMGIKKDAIYYFQSFGLGFFEYFQLAEDFGAEPLPILSCGIACQFNTGEVVPRDELDPYVQDALDLIEFANGPVDSKWGKVRAGMGHPEPFNMKYIGIGNEQWGQDYFDRLEVFTQSIKAAHPEIIIVSGTGPFPDGEHFEFAEKKLREMDAEIVDEHYYRSPEWFRENADRYDSYPRDSYKVFAGEYAAQSVAIASPDNKNNWNCALSEAAYMTGLERNADVVHMTSYAPLMAHAEAWQWTPDLIWFDNLRSYGTPNYYVQKLFSTNRGTHLLDMKLDGEPAIGQHGIYASAVKDANTGEIILKTVNFSDQAQTIEAAIEGVRRLASKGSATVLKSESLDAVNSLDQPGNISPVENKIAIKGKKVNVTMAPYSFYVIKVKTQ